MLDHYSEGLMAVVCFGVNFADVIWVHCFCRGIASQNKVVLSEHLHPMMKNFYSEWAALFQDDNVTSH